MEPWNRERTPGGGRRGDLVALVTVALVASAGACDRASAPARRADACDPAVQLAPGPWGADERAALHEVFTQTGRAHAEDLWTRVDVRLTAFHEDWRRARARVCDPQPAVRACMATRAQRYRSIVAALRELGDESIDFAVDAAAALEPASDCARAHGEFTGLRAPALDELRAQVEDARALALTGQVWAGIDRARAAADAIAAADGGGASGEQGELAALAVDARSLLGGLLADTGDAAAGLEQLELAERSAWTLNDRYRIIALKNARARVVRLHQRRVAPARARSSTARWRRPARLGELRRGRATRARHAARTRALLLEAAGDHRSAEAAYRAALALHAMPRADGLTTPAVSAIMNHLGTVLIRQGRHDDASELLARARDRYIMDYGEQHPVLALALNNLGLAHQRQGQYVEAQADLEHALELQEQRLGPDDPRLAPTLDNLGLVTRKLGSFSRARECSARALELYSRSFGPDNLRLVSPLANLGNIARERGELVEAREQLARALAIQEEQGDDDRALAHALHDLANVHGRLGELEQAEQHFRRALTLLEGALGPEDPDLKGPLIGLGNVARDRGELERAREHYERALGLMRAHFGDEHPEVAVALFNLGNIHKDLGRLGAAEAHYRHALAIREQALRPDHPLVVKNLTTLGKLLVARGRPADAIAPLEQGLALQEDRRTPAEELASHRFLLARALWDAGGDDDARARARALAEQAEAGFAEAGARFAQHHQDVERWLRRTAS
ncbi:MAG: tetratricopeptide repeat protein [Myxococcales bacterium]|nr:tetratricopeptide repeat protein [Myxococcales bacterium]